MKTLRDLWDDWNVPITALLLIIVFLGGTIIAVQWMSQYVCVGQTADIGLPHRWLFWGGCQVFEGGKWIPLENWRYWGK